MDFQEAQARFQWLEGQFRASALSDPQYQSALNELRVTDPWGRLWAPQAHSGVWHVFYNGAWVAAQPPVQLAIAPPPAPVQPPPYQAYPTAQASPNFQANPEVTHQKKESSLLFRYLRAFVIWLFIWVLIAGGLWIFYVSKQEGEGQEIMIGIGVAAVLSLVLMLSSMRGGWKGQVVEIRIVKEQQGDEDGTYYVDVRYAIIRQMDGKLRKEPAMPDWQEGDWLEKKQGENWVNKLT
jgi:hypothetical protein